MHRLLLK